MIVGNVLKLVASKLACQRWGFTLETFTGRHEIEAKIIILSQSRLEGQETPLCMLSSNQMHTKIAITVHCLRILVSQLPPKPLFLTNKNCSKQKDICSAHQKPQIDCFKRKVATIQKERSVMLFQSQIAHNTLKVKEQFEAYESVTNHLC